MDIKKKAFQKWHTNKLIDGGFEHYTDCRYFKSNTNTPIDECLCHCYDLQIWNAAQEVSISLLEQAFNEGYSHGLDDGHPLGKSTSGGEWDKSELFESIKDLT
jgi:hypothetical protein